MTKFYQVGGSVRDELMGLKSKDIDYAVEAPSYDDMREAILGRGGEIFLETPQYLTIRARVPNLGACDFVLCRKDGAYSDGRHPDKVEVGTIYDDLARRDFTVNAIARDEKFNYLDPHEGVRDILNKHIRCVGRPRDRYTEDGLRMVRAIRFAVTKGFDIVDSSSVPMMSGTFFVPRMSGVSSERVREELVKCFQHDTLATWRLLNKYPDFRDYLLTHYGVWLKPTLEER